MSRWGRAGGKRIASLRTKRSDRRVVHMAASALLNLLEFGEVTEYAGITVKISRRGLILEARAEAIS